MRRVATKRKTTEAVTEVGTDYCGCTVNARFFYGTAPDVDSRSIIYTQILGAHPLYQCQYTRSKKG